MRSTAFTSGGDQVRWSDLPGGPAAAGLPATVYLHGLGGTGPSVFGHIAGHPLLGGRRALVVDLPGHGHSDRPTEFGYTLEEHAAAVAAVLDDAGVVAVDLVGHSMGGSIGIVLAQRRPDLVGRLVVAEPVLDRLAPTTSGLGSQWMASMTEAAFVERGWAELSADDPGWGMTLRICAPLAVHRSAVALIAGTEPSLRTILGGLPISRTFIAGADGEGVERAEGLEALGVRVVVIAAAGHSMMVDQPEAFVGELAGVLAG
jgi:pimeloyl-ACP methyl ester carboxylesterase